MRMFPSLNKATLIPAPKPFPSCKRYSILLVYIHFTRVTITGIVGVAAGPTALYPGTESEGVAAKRDPSYAFVSTQDMAATGSGIEGSDRFYCRLIKAVI